ncbi:MAG TPA: murein biosynthesis integral membrane protein MurJ [Acidimicrobiia bacterium]
MTERSTDDGAEHRLVRSSAVVGLGTALSRITGFLRVSALAALGFARLTDVYNIANSTPNIVYELLLGGILTATLVPLYVEHYERDDQRATDAINSVAIASLAAITILGFIAAPWIIDLYMLRLHGAGKAAQQALATDLLRWFMPQVFFYGLTALATAMLNARRRFAAAAFAPVLNNVVVIAVLLALPRIASEPPTVTSVLQDPALVLLLGLGTTAGIIAMALVLWPALRHAGARLHWVWEWRHPAVRQLARLSGWTIGYVATNQVAFWVALFLSYGHSGDASIYLAAFTFFQLPHGLFAVSIMTALAPELASRASRGDFDGLRAQFAMGFRLMGLVVIPAAAILFVLARPIVNALLDYGSFSAHDGAATAETLAAFAVGLFSFSAYLFTLRGFYAMQDTRTPFLLNAFENGLNIVFAFALYPLFGVQGLALSWSIAYIIAMVASLAAMRRRLGRLEGRRTADTLGRVLVATAVLAALAWGVATAIGDATPGRAILATAAALVVGLAGFLAVLQVLHVGELALLRDALRRRPLRAAEDPA